MEEKRQQTNFAETLLDDGSHRVQSMQLSSRVAGKVIIGILLMIQISVLFKYFMGQISSTTTLVNLEGQACNIRDVSFSMKLDGTVLRGTLFQPIGSSSTNKVPVVAWSSSLSATMNLGGAKYLARAICDAGFAVMKFDYKSYGYSDGEPRCVINWWEFLDGYRDALDFVESQEFVDKDRIVVYGPSLGGGLALTLGAIDPRVKAIIAAFPGPITNIPENADADAFASFKQTLLERSYLQAPSSVTGPLPVVTSDPNSTTLSWFGTNGLLMHAPAGVDISEAAANARHFWLFQGAMDPSWRNETTWVEVDTPQHGTPDLAVHFVYQPVLLACSYEDVVNMASDCVKLLRAIPSKDKELTFLMGGHTEPFDTDYPNFGDRPPAFYDFLDKILNFLKRLYVL